MSPKSVNRTILKILIPNVKLTALNNMYQYAHGMFLIASNYVARDTVWAFQLG